MLPQRILDRIKGPADLKDLTWPQRRQLAEEIRGHIDPYVAAGHGVLDDVIDPADTRAWIATL